MASENKNVVMENVEDKDKKEKEDEKESAQVEAEPDTKADDAAEDDAEAEAEEEELAPVEKPTELEEDAATDTRPKITSGAAALNIADTTLNVIPSAEGRLLMALTDGGMQYLLAGARANVGLKAGRYAFEMQLVQALFLVEPAGVRGHAPQPRTLVRVGVSTAGSSQLLGDAATSVCFDSEGHFCCGGDRSKVVKGRPLRRGQTMTIVVNLDSGSPNANTISLFIDGTRVSKPQQLPEALQGKPLFPTVAYRGATVRLNLGPSLLAKLPFACRSAADAAKEDIEIATPTKATQREVVVPVGLPGEGPNDFVDSFLSKHPQYEELSERRMLEWAKQSGMARPEASATASKVLASVSPLLERNFILTGVKKNLLAAERKQEIAPFVGFKKVALVAMGEPSAEHKEFVQKALLAEKKSKVVAKAKKEAQERKRKRLIEERKKRNEDMRASKKQKTEEPEDKEASDEDDKVEKEKAPPVEEEFVEPEVALDEEEKRQWFRKGNAPDISPESLSKSYADFSMPSVEEGFDEVRYAWQPAEVSADRLRAWILERKRTQRVETLQPSQWFKDEWSKWQKAVKGWKEAQSTAKKEAKDGKKTEDVADVFGVEDVMNACDGVPLFLNFQYEDWVLLNLRYELHLLSHAFRKDMDDPDRTTFTLELAPYYYEKYVKKSLTPKQYGMEKLEDVFELVKDSVDVNDSSMVVGKLPEDAPLDGFVKHAEEQRRDRERRTDAGDESAQLKFSRAPPAERSTKDAKGHQKGGQQSKGGHVSKGGNHSKDRQYQKGGKADHRYDSQPKGKGASWGSGAARVQSRPAQGYEGLSGGKGFAPRSSPAFAPRSAPPRSYATDGAVPRRPYHSDATSRPPQRTLGSSAGGRGRVGTWGR